LSNLGEFELIDWIREQAGGADHLALGIGDDCAIQKLGPDQDLLISTDLLIEGVHFKREWTTLYNLGRKAAAVNISDIAAMGGAPQSLFLGIGRPAQISDLDMKELLSGFIYETQMHGAVLAGGDSCGSPGPLMLSVTVQGTVATDEAICRQGASYGDAIYVSGTLGDSALALQLLQAGQIPEKSLAERFHLPSPRVELGKFLSARQIATAMLDVSDGLLADLGHILTASEVGAELELDMIPLSAAFQHQQSKQPSIRDLALSGGEDYELVFTSPLKDLAEQTGLTTPVARIGTITQKGGIQIRQADGQLYHCQRAGFDHFA
jgi:thiamine-monophosphate kinase